MNDIISFLVLEHCSPPLLCSKFSTEVQELISVLT